MCRMHNDDEIGVLELSDIPMERDPADAQRSAIRQLIDKAKDPATPRSLAVTAGKLAVRLALTLPLLGVAMLPSHAQQLPPAAQVQAKPPLTPGQQSYDQLDADLHALVNTINARLQAVNDDMTQLRAHVDQQAKPVPESPPKPEHKPEPPKPGTPKP